MLGIYVRTSKDDDKADESPIEQQKRAGIQFAEKHKYSYEVYADKGISGFKISEDDKNVFKNRPRFTDLISDVKTKKINMIWVWEHSRLSRNKYGSAVIFNIFEKYKIKVFEKDKEFDLDDPESQVMRDVLDSISQYERSLILRRTKRGLHSKIDQGKRSFGKLYGYQKSGVDLKGYQVLEKVESEIENITYGYKRILEGATLKKLTMELYNNKSFDKSEALRLSRYWHKILCHFSYTGFELNVEGLEIKRKFDEFKIDNLSLLNDEKYYSKSHNYPHELVTIGNWIKVVERLRINRQIRKEKTRKASKDLATGLIQCSECGQKYYSYTHTNKKDGRVYDYVYYKHYAAIKDVIKCNQKKSFAVENTNDIFKLFFFYFYMVFDNTPELIQESQRIIKMKQLKLKEQIKSFEKSGRQYEKQIVKFNRVLDDTEDTGEIKILARRINEAEENIITNEENLSRAKIEFEQLNEQYADTEEMNTYYNVVDRVKEFFGEIDIEEQRNSLMKVIRECRVFTPFLLIDTGTVIFLFNTEQKNIFKNTMLNNLDKDKIYKEHFVESLSPSKQFLDIIDLEQEAIQKNKIYNRNEITIFDCKLNRINKIFNTMIAEQLFKKHKIN
jgi:DNA invertase Pin-like site-specific DNA recombinase